MEKILKNKIKNLLDKLINYTRSETIKPMLADYINKVAEQYNNQDELTANMDSILSSFLFDYEIEDDIKYIDFFIEENPELTEEEIKIVTEFKNSVMSFFCITKVGKDFFEAYSLLNEKIYTIKPVDNFLNYKYFSEGMYLHTRILPLDNYYFFYGQVKEFSPSSKRLVLQLSAMIQTQEPSVLIKDNPEKLQQIINNNTKSYKNFIELFKTNEIFTCGKHIDQILQAFHYFNDNKEQIQEDITHLIGKTKKFYFDSNILNEIENQMSPENMTNMYEDCHDIGIVFDESTGLHLLPFYATFLEIFSNPNFKEIQEYKECIIYYLEEDIIPPYPIEKVAKEFPENSKVLFAELFEIEDFSLETDLSDLLNEYKYDYYKNHRMSVNTIFQESNTFKELIAEFSIEELESPTEEFRIEDFQNVGRNDPCPCGSGKKFKKCCIDKIK